MSDDAIIPRENRTSRAGSYIRQPTGYRAFVPASLPPDPQININPEMQRLLSESDAALGRLDGSIQTLPNPDMFMFMYIRKEALLSSQIEGTQASLSDLIKAEASLFEGDRQGDVGEVINYINAMNYGLERLNTLPLSVRLIREIHERLLKGVRGSKMTPGELRTSQNWIGPRGCLLSDATFVPPPHHAVPQILGDLETFLHQEDHIPPLIRIGLAHAQFETIHPFLDGNGRIGRLLITLFLCQQRILEKPVLYISLFLKDHQTEYYEQLQRIRDYGDWEGWLKFFLTGVRDVARQATATARNIVALREKHRSLVVDHFGGSAGNALRVLEHLYEQPGVSVNTIKDTLKISFPNANNLVSRFVELELLFEVTGNYRNRVFVYRSYTELFSPLNEAM
jgi:Fic family protein